MPRNGPDTRVRQAVRVSYLLRLMLPDRPGALGAVATALGLVGADILSVDVIERAPGSSATDDFVVELPPVDEPFSGFASSHVPPSVVVAVARQASTPADVLVIRSSWATGLAAPCAATKLKLVGLTPSPG